MTYTQHFDSREELDLAYRKAKAAKKRKVHKWTDQVNGKPVWCLSWSEQ